MTPRQFVLPLVLALSATACASTGHDAARDSRSLALYRAHAVERVGSIPFSGSIDRWTGLGDSALAVWTSPSRAWLLELGASCPYLESSYAIGFDSNDGRVDAGFDSVVPLSAPGPQFPCRIRTIHRLDVEGLRAAERAQESGT